VETAGAPSDLEEAADAGPREVEGGDYLEWVEGEAREVIDERGGLVEAVAAALLQRIILTQSGVRTLKACGRPSYRAATDSQNGADWTPSSAFSGGWYVREGNQALPIPPNR
jgi:hypothetical protein